MNELSELARSPTAEYANAQPWVQIRPLDKSNDGRTLQFGEALHIPRQVAECARGNLHAMLWKCGSQMGSQERLEVQRRKAAGQLDIKSGRFCWWITLQGLEGFDEFHG